MSVLHDEGVLFLTTAEVATILRSTAGHVRAMAGNGHLPGAVQFGTRWLFNRAILAEHLGVISPSVETTGQRGEECADLA